MICITSPYRHDIQHNHAFDQLGKILFPVLSTELPAQFFFCEEITKKEKFGVLKKSLSVINSIIISRPNLLTNHWPKERRREFRRLLKTDAPSLIHFEYFQCTYLNRTVRRIGFSYTLHDSFLKNNPYFSAPRGLKRMYQQIQFLLLILHESRVIKNAKKVFVFNTEDYNYVIRKKGQPILVEIGIHDSQPKWNLQNLQKLEIVFAGALWRRENEEICIFIIDQVLPKIIKDYPAIKFVFLGSKPSYTLIEKVRRTNGAEIRADVENFAKEISESSIALCLSKVHPGISLKFLQSLKIGIPTIANKNVAYSLSGGAENHDKYLLADTPEEICSAIRNIFDSHVLASELVKNAEKFMKDHYTVDTYIESYLVNFREILSSSKKI